MDHGIVVGDEFECSMISVCILIICVIQHEWKYFSLSEIRSLNLMQNTTLTFFTLS